MAIKCADCEYGQFTVGEYGICRRYPPSIKDTSRVEKDGDLIKGLVVYLHPKVHQDDKCGEFLASTKSVLREVVSDSETNSEADPKGLGSWVKQKLLKKGSVE